MLRLQLLKCSQCGAPIQAEGADVVYYCTACRSGYTLLTTEDGFEKEGLVPLEVSFVSAPNVAVGRYLPFWLLPATVTIRERRASGGSIRGLLGKLTGQGAEGSGPSRGEGTFVIPAFDAALAQTIALARRYTEAFPQLGERLGERLVGGRLSARDAEKLAHFTLIAAEAERPDTLQNLDYSIEFGQPRLLGVPFVDRGGRWVDALYGLPV